jgi:hypothetical protein
MGVIYTNPKRQRGIRSLADDEHPANPLATVSGWYQHGHHTLVQDERVRGAGHYVTDSFLCLLKIARAINRKQEKKHNVRTVPGTPRERCGRSISRPEDFAMDADYFGAGPDRALYSG